MSYLHEAGNRACECQNQQDNTLGTFLTTTLCMVLPGWSCYVWSYLGGVACLIQPRLQRLLSKASALECKMVSKMRLQLKLFMAEDASCV